MNCRCLSGCHPVISKQFSHSPTATTHSPCGRFSHFSLIWHWIWFWICTSTNSASPTGSYWGKRSCIWTLACTTQARWFLERKKSSLANVSLPGNSFWLQRPPPLILQVSGRAKMSGESSTTKSESSQAKKQQMTCEPDWYASGDRLERSELPGSDPNPIGGTSPWTSPAGIFNTISKLQGNIL